MKFPKILLLTLTIGLVNASMFSQTENDLASWTSLQLRYEIDDNWDLGLEGQLRLKTNISNIDEYFTEFSARRKLVKGLRFGIGLRYIRENDNRGSVQGYEDHFRFHIDINYKHKLDGFRIGYRLRYTNKNELGVSRDEGDFALSRLRFKTGLEYKIKNWPLDPELAGELFSRFENNEDPKIDKYRITLATSYGLKKAGSLGVYYRIESSIGEEITEYQHIIGLRYKYVFNSR